MAKFLTREEVYRMLQRELPEGVYPDGAPSAYYSTADMDSVAQVASTAYENLERIYDNFFPQTADEKLSDWETAVFGKRLPASLSIEERRDRVLTKIRARKGLRKSDIKAEVHAVIGSDKVVDIIEWGDHTGGWMLDWSTLDIGTYLNGQALSDVTPFLFPEGDLCEGDPSDFGKTEDEWLEMREDAYTYEVLIYDYTPTADELADINEKLNVAEPARANRIITSGLDGTNYSEGED